MDGTAAGLCPLAGFGTSRFCTNLRVADSFLQYYNSIQNSAHVTSFFCL